VWRYRRIMRRGIVERRVIMSRRSALERFRFEDQRNGTGVLHGGHRETRHESRERGDEDDIAKDCHRAKSSVAGEAERVTHIMSGVMDRFDLR